MNKFLDFLVSAGIYTLIGLGALGAIALVLFLIGIVFMIFSAIISFYGSIALGLIWLVKTMWVLVF